MQRLGEGLKPIPDYARICVLCTETCAASLIGPSNCLLLKRIMPSLKEVDNKGSKKYLVVF